MANPTLTVYAYGNVDALHGIFNAVAMIMNSGDFAGMMRLAIVVGFCVVATLMLMPNSIHKGWNWFIAVVVITSVMLIPKADVSIVDRTAAQSTVVVSNVPWTLALMASVKSAVGMTLTETFETAFQTIPAASRALPSQLSYLDNGMMFGSRLVRASREAQPSNSYDQTDLVAFIRSCVVPELGRNIGADTAARTTDLQSVFSNTNPALSSAYHDASANWVLKIDTCPSVWNALQNRLNAAGVAAVAKVAATTNSAGFALNNANATAQADAAISAVYGRASLANASATASSIMVQNILINATADAAAQLATSNDPGVLLLASMRTQAIAQMNAGNMVQARIAEEALPIVRNITEGLIYAMFPLFCVLLVASDGRAMAGYFKTYVLVMLWVELWPPMFAIVNYLETLAAVKELASAAYMAGGGGTGLSVNTASAVYSTSVSSLATTSWMVTFVPVLAAAVLFGFDKIMTITGATGGAAKAAQSEAAAATKGNASMGNVSFDQRNLASYESSPSMYSTTSVGGTQTRDVLTGQRVEQYASSRHLSTMSSMNSIGEGISAAAQATEASSQRNQKSYETSIDAAYGAARSAMQGYSTSASRQLGYDVSKVGSTGLAATEVDDEAKRIAKQHGIQDSSKVAKNLGLALGGLPASLIGIKAGASTSEEEALARSFTSSVDTLQKKGLARKQEIAESFRSGEGFEQARRSNRDATARVESSLREASGFREAISQDLTRSKQLSSDWQAFQRYAQSNQTDFGNQVELEYMRRGWSVHDGVADPRRHEQVIRALFEQGSFRPDGPGGQQLFVPASKGFGPSPAAVAPALEAAAGGSSGLGGDFASAVPGGGRGAVQQQATSNNTREGAIELRLGVSPSNTVSGDSVKAAAVGGQARATAAADEAAPALRQSQGAAQIDYDSRAKKTSDAHNPIQSANPVTGASIRNPALDGTRGFDGASSRPFTGAADDERKTRSEAAAKAQAALSTAVIPTAPTK